MSLLWAKGDPIPEALNCSPVLCCLQVQSGPSLDAQHREKGPFVLAHEQSGANSGSLGSSLCVDFGKNSRSKLRLPVLPKANTSLGIPADPEGHSYCLSCCVTWKSLEIFGKFWKYALVGFSWLIQNGSILSANRSISVLSPVEFHFTGRRSFFFGLVETLMMLPLKQPMHVDRRRDTKIWPVYLGIGSNMFEWILIKIYQDISSISELKWPLALHATFLFDLACWTKDWWAFWNWWFAWEGWTRQQGGWWQIPWTFF